MAAISISNTDFSSETFKEAFAIARNEVGFPGIFYWGGKPFHTGTKSEVDSMSPEEWTDFSASIKETLSGLNLSSTLSGFTADQATAYVPTNLADGFQPDAPPEITEILTEFGGAAASTSKSLEEEIADMLPSVSAPMFTAAALTPENGFLETIADSIGGFLTGIASFCFSED